MKIYKVTNTIENEFEVVEAHNADEAIRKCGWRQQDCTVDEKRETPKQVKAFTKKWVIDR
jgi:hypothetical protein